LDHFELIQSDWKKFRDFPGLAGMSKVESFDQAMIAIATTENQAISHADAVLLCNLFQEMEAEALSTLTAPEDKKVVSKLGLFLRGLPDDTLMKEIVEDYPSNDNNKDSDYMPGKGRGSRKKRRLWA
jgi:hypothetical protein